MDESFSMDLELPHGDASLATSPNLAVTILSNDNAYGRMAFSDSSLRVNITEQSWDSVLRLNVLREYGSFGQVSLNWNITSMDGSTVVDLYPTSGQVNLNQGISSANILIYVRADGTPELNEEFRVRFGIFCDRAFVTLSYWQLFMSKNIAYKCKTFQRREISKI